MNKHPTIRQAEPRGYKAAPVDDAGELEKDGEPSFDPDSVFLGNADVLAGVFPEGVGFVGDVLGAVANEPDGFHAGVGKSRVAGELGKAFHGVLERVDRRTEILFEYRS